VCICQDKDGDVCPHCGDFIFHDFWDNHMINCVVESSDDELDDSFDEKSDIEKYLEKRDNVNDEFD
jgi:hypothetical protein